MREQVPLSPAAASVAAWARRKRQRILNIAEDFFRQLWHALTTTPAEPQAAAAFAGQGCYADQGSHDGPYRIALRLADGSVSTVVAVPRPLPSSCDARRTPAAVVERVRAPGRRSQRAPDRPERLNAEGHKSGRGGAFTANKVQWIRYVHGIRSGCPEAAGGVRVRGQRGDGRCSALGMAAQALNVDVSTIAAWCKCRQSTWTASRPFFCHAAQPVVGPVDARESSRRLRKSTEAALAEPVVEVTVARYAGGRQPRLPPNKRPTALRTGPPGKGSIPKAPGKECSMHDSAARSGTA